MADSDMLPYRDPDRSVDARVTDLLGRLSLAEKAGQLVGTWAGRLTVEKSLDDVEREVRAGVGAVSPFGVGPTPVRDPVRAAETANRLQRTAVEETRLGIPLFVPVDAIHGHAYVEGTTVFPHGLGLGATRDADLVERCARVTAREARATGATTTYAPTCDLARDQRWGRTFETFGETPWLCGDLAAAKVRGYQHDLRGGVAATAKHFPAYGGGERGEDAAPVDVGPRGLWATYLPPFERALAAGVEAVMPTYSAVDRDPAHGSRWLLTDLLRDDLGFEGLVTSDWMGVAHLHDDHHTAASPEAAVEQSRRAGLDLASVGATDHADALRSLIDSGVVAERTVDDSVRRVLSLKFRLGLFEDPYVDTGDVWPRLRTDDHRAVAREAARASLTLLADDGTLPLAADADVLVTGPSADEMAHHVGGWSATGAGGETISEALPAHTDGVVTCERGVTLTDREDVDAAARAAADADAAVVACGEGWYVHEFGGESHDGAFPRRTDLRLPGAQRELIAAVEATGTPTVVVLLTGRPVVTPWLVEHCSSLLLAYYPGNEGGHAVAETLMGAADPGGALPVSVPRSTGHLPTRVEHAPHPRPTGPDRHAPRYDPLFPFGHGLSYTGFALRDVSLSTETVGPGDRLSVSVTVENTGERAGTDVLDLFVCDPVSGRVTPTHRHVGSGRVSVPAGECETVPVAVEVRDLGVAGPDGRTVEPGSFTLSVGLDGPTRTFEVRS